MNNIKQTKKHQGREDLTGEHFIGDAGQLILAILFFIIWIGDTFFFKLTTFLNSYINVWFRIPIGTGLLIYAFYLSRSALAIVFGEVRETPAVIRKGVFNYVRHPVYLSEILLYLGMLILSFSISAAVIWIIAILFLYFISRHEEKLLLQRFGEEYATYMKEVPMWFPRLF